MKIYAVTDSREIDRYIGIQLFFYIKDAINSINSNGDDSKHFLIESQEIIK